MIAPARKHIHDRHAGLAPASGPIPDSRLRGNRRIGIIDYRSHNAAPSARTPTLHNRLAPSIRIDTLKNLSVLGDHLQKSLDPHPGRAGIALRKMRLRLQIGKAQISGDEPFHQGGLLMEGVAGLQDRIDHRLYPILYDDAFRQTKRPRRKRGLIVRY